MPAGFNNPNYENDGRYTIKLNCKDDKDLKYLEDTLSIHTKEECKENSECMLNEPKRIGTVLYDKIKLKRIGDHCILSLMPRQDEN